MVKTEASSADVLRKYGDAFEGGYYVPEAGAGLESPSEATSWSEAEVPP